MDSDRGSEKRNKARLARQIGIYTTLPFLMAACPLVGGYLGHLADGRFGSAPWLTLVGAFLGLGAGLRQTILLIREADDKEKNNKE